MSGFWKTRWTFVLLACVAGPLVGHAAEYSRPVEQNYPKNVYWGDTHLHTRNSADAYSLGNMNPEQVSFICDSLKSVWQGPLGIHTHDNKGLALINSLTALESGVTWCDSTITGMGRGAGNVNTEALLMECASRGLHAGNAQSLVCCSERFAILKQEHQWGPNPHYHFAANHNIHPTYVQSILNDTRYESDDVATLLKSLSQKKYRAEYNQFCIEEV